MRVRKALNYAINYDELIQYVEMGKVTRLYGTCPIGILGHNPDVTPKYTYDPERAKSLLKEAGVSEGLEVTLLTSISRHAPFEDMLPYIVSYLKDVGIEAKAQKLSFSTQYAKMMKREFDLALNCWNPYNPDPSETSLAYYQSYRWKQGFGWSFAFYDNKELDELLAVAEENMDRKERAQQYKKADQITVENAAAAPLYQTHETIAMRDDIKGLDWHSTLWYKGFKSLYR